MSHPQPPGRRPEWLIAEPGQLLPYLDTAMIGADGFTSLPIFGRRLVPWLDELGESTLLCDLRRPGCARVSPWEAEGVHARDAIQAYADDTLRSGEETERLLVLRAQFVRLQLYKKGRLKLPMVVLAQLDAALAAPTMCYVAFLEDKFELWSRGYRDARVERFGIDIAEVLKAED